jgi:hypothetical protein
MTHFVSTLSSSTGVAEIPGILPFEGVHYRPGKPGAALRILAARKRTLARRDEPPPSIEAGREDLPAIFAQNASLFGNRRHNPCKQFHTASDSA